MLKLKCHAHSYYEWGWYNGFCADYGYYWTSDYRDCRSRWLVNVCRNALFSGTKLPVSLYLCLCISLCPSFTLCISVSVSLCPSVSLYVSLPVSFCLSLSVYICLSLFLVLCLCFWFSFCPSQSLYVSLYLALSLPYLSMSSSVCLSVAICMSAFLSLS